MNDPKDAKEVDVETDLGVSPDEEAAVEEGVEDGLATDEPVEPEQAQPVESEADEAEEAQEAIEAAAAEQAEDAEEADVAAGQQEQPADEAEKPEPPVVGDTPKSTPKPAVNIGDLVAVGILSLIMGAIMVYIMMVAAPAGGGIAATVNGTTISEDQITEYVAQLRKQQGVEEESAWGEFLVTSQLTPKTLRSGLIDQFVNQELVKQAIKEQNVTVPAEDVDAYIAQITEQQGGEEALNEALQQQGVTMEQLREDVELGLAQQKFAEQIAGDVEAADDEILDLLKMYGAADADAESLDDIDEGMVESFREQVKSQKVGQAYSEWMNEYRSKAEIKIEDMPKDLPYDIDLAPYEEAAKAAAAEAAQDGSMDDAEGSEAEAIELEEAEVDEGKAAESAEASAASAEK